MPAAPGLALHAYRRRMSDSLTPLNRQSNNKAHRRRRRDTRRRFRRVISISVDSLGAALWFYALCRHATMEICFSAIVKAVAIRTLLGLLKLGGFPAFHATHLPVRTEESRRHMPFYRKHEDIAHGSLTWLPVFCL